jgi:hypothetical protein
MNIPKDSRDAFIDGVLVGLAAALAILLLILLFSGGQSEQGTVPLIVGWL